MRVINIFSLCLILLSIPFLGTRASGEATDSPPLLYGYGGILATGSIHITSGSRASEVFTGETASNTEITFARLKSLGYNAARVAIIDPGNQPDSVSYNSNAWHRTLQLAQHYGITVIGDDHEYTITSSWLPFWQAVVQDTPQSQYPNVLWEAQNEPHDNSLAADFQAFIDMVRGQGDTRWIILACNDDCTPSGRGSDLSAFPIVTDSANHIFYDFHEYFFYASHSNEWTVSAAQAFADSKFQAALDVQAVLGRPFIGTEFGADTGCGATACPPNQTVPGSAGYSPETVAYLSRLISNLHGASIGYMVWNAGDWNDAPAGISGALDTFGSQLPPPPPTSSPPPSSPPPAILPPAIMTWLPLILVVLIVGLFTGILVRRRTRRQPRLLP